MAPAPVRAWSTCHSAVSGATWTRPVQEGRMGGMYKVSKSDEQWQAELDPLEYQVLRHAATERPSTDELLHEDRVGIYHCRACGAELFRSTTKFEAHCGWPSFYQPPESDAVELIEDRSLGMVRTEVRCRRCGSHLGHVFDDAPQTPTGDRYCMNSVSLSFEPGEPGSSAGGGSSAQGGSSAAGGAAAEAE